MQAWMPHEMQLGVRQLSQIFAHQIQITMVPSRGPATRRLRLIMMLLPYRHTRHNTTMFRVEFPILVMEFSWRKGKSDNSKCTPSYLDDQLTLTRRWIGRYSTGSGVVGTAFSESISLWFSQMYGTPSLRVYVWPSWSPELINTSRPAVNVGFF